MRKMLRAGRPRLLRRIQRRCVEGSIPRRASLSGISRLLIAAALALWLPLTASQAFAQSSKVHDLATNTTNPLPTGSCLYVDQNSVDTKLCSNWATAIGALLPNLSNLTATALPSGFTLPSPALTGTVTGANTIPYSILQQASQRTILGNATTSTANITASWTVSGDQSKLATVVGSLINGHCVNIDALGNIGDAGAPCSSGGGGGSVTSVGLDVPAASLFSVSGSPIVAAGSLSLRTTGTSGGIPYFSSGTQLSSSAQMPANHAILGGGAGTAPADSKVTITIPATGSTLTVADGKTATFNATTTFGGTDGKTVAFNAGLTFAGTDGTTQTFQATDTILGRATTDTLTNKTYDTAGTGNVFKIAGAQLTAISGTGSTVCLTTSCVMITPTLGVASVTSVNKWVLTAPATSITLTGTDGTTYTYPTVSDTLVGRATGTFTSPVILPGYTVAGLPAGTVGMIAYVTNALACTFLATVSGGGAVVCPVFYDGVSWKGG